MARIHLITRREKEKIKGWLFDETQVTYEVRGRGGRDVSRECSYWNVGLSSDDLGGQRQMVVGVEEEEWEGERTLFLFSSLRIHSSGAPRHSAVSPTHLM